MRGWIRFVRVSSGAGLLALLNACGDPATAPSPPPQLNLAGAWSGTYGPAGSGTALRVTWDATQTGNIVSGIATLVKPAVGVQARGALTGTLDGDRILLSLFVPTDSIAGHARCSITGVGTATATASRIAGPFPLMFGSCEGTGLEPPANNELVLMK